MLIISYHSAPRGVVRLTHEELAEIVGASRPSLSVVFSELAEHGLIEPAGRGRILIDDWGVPVGASLRVLGAVPRARGGKWSAD